MSNQKFNVIFGPMTQGDAGALIALVSENNLAELVNVVPVGKKSRKLKAPSGVNGKGKGKPVTKAEVETINTLHKLGATMPKIISKTNRSRQTVTRVIRGELKGI